MEFFVDKPELLDGTQTLLGVLLTFIVLCLFNNDSNFLLTLICNMVADFTANLKDKIDEINKQIEEEKKQSNAAMGEIANNRSYWVSQSKKWPELNKALMDNNKEELDVRNQILKDVDPELESYKASGNQLKMKEENRFISLYFLILMLIVMTMDACCVGKDVGCIFLILENVITFYFTGCLWLRFWVEKDKGLVKYNEHKHIFIIVFLGVLVMVTVWVALMTFSILPSTLLWLLTIGTITLVVVAFSYWLMHKFRYSVRYNNQFIIKHALYIAFVSMVVTCILFFFCSIDVENFEEYRYMMLYNLQENVKNIAESIYWVRLIFIILCAANTFFIPLLIGYFYNHTKAKHILQIMNRSKDEIIEKLKKNNNEYQTIVKNIQKKHNIMTK